MALHLPERLFDDLVKEKTGMNDKCLENAGSAKIFSFN